MPQPHPSYLPPEATLSDAEAIQFIVGQLLADVQTVTLVKVVKVYQKGELKAVGAVDVQPLVMQVAGDGSTVPHGTISRVPYFRLQGGASAVILDPSEGDIGLCAFGSRDLSGVIRAKEQAPPLSHRRFDYSDGLYMGGFLNAVPTQYVRFSASGIELNTPNAITLTAKSLQVNGPTVFADSVTMKKTLTVEQEATAKGVALSSHTHSGVKPGGANTGGPQ